MSDGTKIEWADASWQVTRGCTKVSEGCRRCYAMRMAHRFSGPGKAYEGLTKLIKSGPTWTGDVRLVPENLDQPLHWRKPRRVFVNSMSDLFHPGVPFEFIAAVFGVMAACPQHTFQVLTKRPVTMGMWFEWAQDLPQASGKSWRDGAPVAGYLGEFALRLTKGACNIWGDGKLPDFPLPNVHLYVSVEDQPTADERIPHLLATPAAVRGVSAEPLLGPIDFVGCREDEYGRHDVLRGFGFVDGRNEPFETPKLDHVIVGGESGPGARPCHVEWIRSIVEQCRAAGVPPFVKQLGARPVVCDENENLEAWPTNPLWFGVGGISDREFSPKLQSRKGSDMSEWPEDLRVQEMPG